MSFSRDVKRELCKCDPPEPAQRRAELYGLLLFGHHFSARTLGVQTENPQVADRIASLLAEEAGVIAEKTAPLSRRGTGGGMISVTVADEGDRRRVLSLFGHDPAEPHVKINRGNWEEEESTAAFLRGAFLSCGTVSDPQKGYRMEFALTRYHLTNSLAALLGECCGGAFHPKTSSRSGGYVVYSKNSEEIADLLTYLGAASASMAFVQVKMVKELRNDLNRRTNFDAANIDKTVSAAAEQIEAIRLLENLGLLGSLPDELQELASLRAEHPELSLRELGALLARPISRSGVNHRLQKLTSLAQKYKK